MTILNQNSTSQSFFMGWYGTCDTECQNINISTSSFRDKIYKIFQIQSDNLTYVGFDGAIPQDLDIAIQPFSELECGKFYIIILNPGTGSVDLTHFKEVNSGSTDSGRVTQICGPVQPQYTLSSNLDSADEGSVVTLTLETTGVDTGTPVSFTIHGSNITLDDFSGLDSLGAGEFTVGADGIATFNLEINSDSTTEGPETFTVTLDDHPSVSIDIDINDTSTSPVIENTILTAIDAEVDDRFGNSVALSSDGSVLAVGSYFWDGPDGNDQGAVYIYDKIGDTWNLRGSVLTASDAETNHYFGSSVALSSDGSVLAVGSAWDGYQGGVYIYDLDKDNDIRTQRGDVLTASDAETNDNFGSSVALSSDGSVLAVGAVYWDGVNNDKSNQGGVYIYDLDKDNDIRTQRGDVLTASDAELNDIFGHSVALSSDGSILAVGAPYWDGYQGGVYIYDLDKDNDIRTQRGDVLTSSDAEHRDYFGSSVALSSDGSVFAVGSMGWDGVNNDKSSQGVVYIYDESSTYTLSSNLDSADEGSVVTLTLETTGVDTGTPVSFTIHGSNITLDDFSGLDSLGAGEFTVGADGIATFELEIKADSTTEGPETFTVTLDDHPSVSIDIDINDTSSPPPTYTLSSDLDSVIEDQVVMLKLETTGVPAGTRVPFTIHGSNITLDDFWGLDSSLTGEFTVGADGSAFFSLSTRYDVDEFNQPIIEYLETFRVILDDHPDVFVDVQILGNYELINLHSELPIDENWYNTYPTIQLKTVHIPAGTSVPFTIHGSNITSNDFSNSTPTINSDLQGTFIVGSHGSEGPNNFTQFSNLYLNINQDFITEGNETFTVTLDDHPDISIDVSINDTTVDPIWIPDANQSVLFPVDYTDSSIQFGYSVSMSDDASKLVVSAWTESPQSFGGVFYYRKENNIWVQKQLITATGPYEISLSGNGNYLCIKYGGEVYSYELSSNDQWVTRGVGLMAVFNRDKFLNFDTIDGICLSYDGNTLFCGGQSDPTDAYNNGTPWYSLSTLSWNSSIQEWDNEVQIPVPEQSVVPQNSRFAYGNSIAISGDGKVLAVGAHLCEPLNQQKGGVFIYDLINGSWVLRTSGNLNAQTPLRGGGFQSVGANSQGEDEIEITVGTDWEEFGRSVSLNYTGDILVVGAVQNQNNNSGNERRGKVYTFHWEGDLSINSPYETRSDNGYWILSSRYVTYVNVANKPWLTIYGSENPLVPSDSETYDKFGTDLTISGNGNTLVVGAPGWDNDSDNVNRQGGVYIFTKT